MATKSAPATVQTPHTAPTSSPTAPPVTPVKAPRPKSQLFAEYAAAHKAYAAAQAALATAGAQRSAAVKAISDGYGPGPYSYGGEILTVTSRKSRDEAGEVVGVSYYFKKLGGTLDTVE